MTIALPPVETRRPLAPRLLVSFVAALSLILGPLAFAPAQAASDFAITGSTVSGEGVDGPLEGVSVELQVFNSDEYFQSYDYANTDEAGEYGFSEVPPGTYRVVVHGRDNLVTHVGTQFDLTADRTLAAITLMIGGSLSGSVTESGSNDPSNDFVVEAFPWNGTEIDRSFDYGTNVDGEDGSFVINGIPAGMYKVEIRDSIGNHVAEYFDISSDLTTAETVTVLRNVDRPLGAITLDVGASFSGRVENADGTPIVDAYVSALAIVDGKADYQNAYRGYSNELGNYVIPALPGGTYKIEFASNFGYFDEFYNDKATEALADAQTVVLGTDKPLGTTVLEQTAAVTGLVTDADGSGVGDILVEAYPVINGTVAADGSDYTYSDDDGAFNLRDLHAGTYRLKVQDGLHVYQDNFDTVVTIEGGETAEVEPIGLTLQPVVVPPAPYSPPAPPAAPAPAPVAKKSASVTVSAKGAKKKATLTITVKASGVTPTGKVTIKLGDKTLKTVTLKNGKAKVTLTKQKKGKRIYKVTYSGDAKVRAKSVNTSKVTIK